MFQTAVFLQSQQAPLEVILENGTYLTKIRSGAAERYHQMFQEIADSGYLAPFVHTNGHAFVADQIPPKEGEKDNRLYLPDGRLIRAYDEKAVSLADWGNNQDAYNKNSYAVPISINGQRMVAQWFKTHIFITDEQDEIYKTLDVKASTRQLIDSGVKCIILENGKESVEKLRQDANLFYKVVSGLEQ